jgi:hypothetical protein
MVVEDISCLPTKIPTEFRDSIHKKKSVCTMHRHQPHDEMIDVACNCIRAGQQGMNGHPARAGIRVQGKHEQPSILNRTTASSVPLQLLNAFSEPQRNW